MVREIIPKFSDSHLSAGGDIVCSVLRAPGGPIKTQAHLMGCVHTVAGWDGVADGIQQLPPRALETM